MLRYFKRRWDESRGDEYKSWGPSDWYFEVDDDCYVIRQLEQYDNGAVLKYDEAYIEDEFGGLAEKAPDLENAWSSMVARNRPQSAG